MLVTRQETPPCSLVGFSLSPSFLLPVFVLRNVCSGLGSQCGHVPLRVAPGVAGGDPVAILHPHLLVVGITCRCV